MHKKSIISDNAKERIIMEVTINGVKKEVSKEEMKDRVIGYYDAVGIKHFYLEVDEMDDEELKEKINIIVERKDATYKLDVNSLTLI